MLTDIDPTNIYKPFKENKRNELHMDNDRNPAGDQVHGRRCRQQTTIFGGQLPHHPLSQAAKLTILGFAIIFQKTLSEKNAPFGKVCTYAYIYI